MKASPVEEFGFEESCERKEVIFLVFGMAVIAEGGARRRFAEQAGDGRRLD